MSRKSFIYLIVIAVFGILAYANTFDAPFLFDDQMYIIDNPAVRDFHFFMDPSRADHRNLGVVQRYLGTRYVTYLTFWANYKAGGLEVWGYHTVNLAIHVINAMLVYVLVLLTFKTPALNVTGLWKWSSSVAMFSALFFVTHPVQTEAVTYISQRFATLSTMFYLLSLVAYVVFRFPGERKVRYASYAFCLLSVFLAMKSKEIAFTLPLAILMYEFMFFRGMFPRRLHVLVPVLLMLLIIPFTYIKMQTGGFIESFQGATRLQTEMPRIDYFLTQLRVITTYIRLLFLPVNQNLDYDYTVYRSILEPSVMASFLFLLSVAGSGMYSLYISRRRPELRLVSFGVFWFFLALSVESSFIPISELIFEYRLYLPLVGAAIAVSGALFSVITASRNKFVSIAVIGLGGLVIMLMLVMTHERNMLWRDETALWEDVVSKSPGKTRPHFVLSRAYDKKGLHDEAQREFDEVLRISPGYAGSHGRSVNQLLDRYKEAVRKYQESVRTNPDSEVAHNNLGVVYEKSGRYEDAEREYLEALRINPYNAKVHNNLGVVYGNTGRHEDAIREYRKALSLQPGYAKAHNNLGVTYRNMGKYEDAIEEYLVAIEIEPGYANAHKNLGIVYELLGRYGDAIWEYRAALDIEPENDEYRKKLERAMELKRERDN